MDLLQGSYGETSVMDFGLHCTPVRRDESYLCVIADDDVIIH